MGKTVMIQNTEISCFSRRFYENLNCEATLHT